MKTRLAVSAAAVLFAALPARAADPAPPPAAAPARPAGFDALQALLRDLHRPEDTTLPLPVLLDRFAARQPSPAVAARLRAAFGTDRLVTFTKQPARPGETQYRATILPLHHEPAPGSRIDWDAGTIDLALDRGGLLAVQGTWSQVGGEDGAMRMTAQGLRLDGRQRRARDGLWFGDAALRIASVRIENKLGMPPVALEDLRFASRATEHGSRAEMGYDGRIGAIAVAGERIEDVRFALRLANVERRALADMEAAARKEAALPADAAPARRAEAEQSVLQAFGLAALGRGAALEIDEISARYHGNQALLRGRVTLEGAARGDLGDAKSLFKNLVARLELRVPLALVRDVAGAVARNVATSQARQNGASPPGEADIERLRQTFTDVAIGRMVGQGYARVENDTIVTTLEWKGGSLRANGKAVPLPGAQAQAALPAAEALPAQAVVATGIGIEQPAVPLGGDVLRARQIEDACRLPDYPDDVVRTDRPLRVTLAYRVDPDGRVRDAAVRVPSGQPAWDAALVAAMGGCTYLPALQDGRPIALPMTWTITRERGTRRPRDGTPAR